MGRPDLFALLLRRGAGCGSGTGPRGVGVWDSVVLEVEG